MNVKHSKEDPNWVTDPDTLAVERALYADLGLTIDLDVFSSHEANLMVQAQRYFTPADDSFNQPWWCRAGHCNHPGGTTVRAWRKLIQECVYGRVQKMQWVGFSTEQLCLLADPGDFPHPADFSLVYLRGRIPFVKEANVRAMLAGNCKKSQPGHNNYIVCMGIPAALVDKHWGSLGRVFHGRFADRTALVSHASQTAPGS